MDKYIRSIRGVNTAVLTTGLLCGQVYSEHQRGQHSGSNYRPVMWTSLTPTSYFSIDEDPMVSTDGYYGPCAYWEIAAIMGARGLHYLSRDTWR